MKTCNSLVLSSLLTMVVLFGCNVDKDSSVNNRQKAIHNRAYLKSLDISNQSFPEGMLNHFPVTVQGQFSMKNTYPQNEKFNPRYGSTLLISSRAEQILELKQKYKLDNFEKIYFEGECTLIVNDTSETAKTKLTKCYTTSLPIPNLPQIFSSQNTKDLSIVDFDIYIVGSQSGRFIGNDYLSKNLHMPDEWQHGYSKGIAINETDKKVIYWFEVW